MAMPLMYRTKSGRLVFSPLRVTSSAIPKSLLNGCSQSINASEVRCGWETAPTGPGGELELPI